MRINTAIYASIRHPKKTKEREHKRFRVLKRWEIIALGYKPELHIAYTFKIWKELLVSALCCSIIKDYELLLLRMLQCF